MAYSGTNLPLALVSNVLGWQGRWVSDKATCLNRIPITVDGGITKQGFERQNGYALQCLFTKKTVDISSLIAAKALDPQSMNEA